jgi:nucleoside-diphosphate-sugar epimerase
MIENKKQRVIVTGAAGFIGCHLVEALLKEGYDVVAILKRRSLPAHLCKEGLKIIQGDIADPSVHQDFFKGADALCHLAAFIPPNYEDSSYAEDCWRTNSLLTLRLAEQALKHKVRFINFSTAAMYRYCDQAVDEDALLYPAQKAVYYAASKLFAELSVEHLRAQGLEAITFRVGSCYGFGMPEKSVVAYFMKSAQQGLTLNVTNAGVARYDYVHVSDVIKLTIAALGSGECGVYNVGTGRSYTVLELAQAIAQAFPERKIKIDLTPLVDPAVLGLPALSIKKAKKVWGFDPLSLTEGIEIFRRDLEKQSTNKKVVSYGA